MTVPAVEVTTLSKAYSGVDPASRDVIMRRILQNFDDESLLLVWTHLIQDVEQIVDGVVTIFTQELRATRMALATAVGILLIVTAVATCVFAWWGARSVALHTSLR